MRSHTRAMFGGWLPGRVERYDADSCRASVQLLILEGYQDEDGERRTEPLPVITDVPVQFPGAGAIRIKWPIAIGDFVTVFFASRAVGEWLESTGGLIDPVDDRDHDLSDALAVPGLLPFSRVSNAGAMIEFTSTEIRCGGTNRLVTKAEFDAHIHNDPTSGVTSAPTIAATGTAKLRG